MENTIKIIGLGSTSATKNVIEVVNSTGIKILEIKICDDGSGLQIKHIGIN